MARRARTSTETGGNIALMILGILALIVAVILIFVPFDGPFGEIIFGLVGIAFLAAGGTASTGRLRLN